MVLGARMRWKPSVLLESTDMVSSSSLDDEMGLESGRLSLGSL